MKILCRAFIAVFLVFLLTLSEAHSRVRYIPIENMPAMADFVIVGTIVDSSCRWDHRGVMIFTDYTILVEDRISGNPDHAIVMSFAGGTVGDDSIFVSNTPKLEVGETYMLFGLTNEKASVPVVGHEQGVFRVLKDSTNGKEYIIDYHGYLLEKLENGQVIRGPLVDMDIKDRLVIITQQVQKKVISPQPVVRDAYGKEIPQQGAIFSKPKCRERGVPLVKSAFVDFTKARISE